MFGSAVDSRWAHATIWFTMSVSCVVFIEPAPYDFLLIFLFALFFSLDLRIPSEIGVAAFLLALFTIGNLIGALHSGEPDVTIRPLITRTYMVLSWLFFTSILATNAESLSRILWSGYTFAAVLATAWGILEYYDLLPQAVSGDAFGRAKGPFKDPNVYGPFLVPIAVHSLSRMLRSSGSVQFAQLLLFLTITLGLLLSFSRGAWLNFAVSLGLFLIFSIANVATMREKIRLIVLSMLLILAAGMTLMWTVNYTAAGQRFSGRAQLFMAYDVETGGRFDTQALALEAIGSNPIGVGPGMSTSELGMEPHNLFLHIGIEGGWLGVVSFCMFLVLTLFRGLKAAKVRWPLQSDFHVVLAVLMGTLFQSFFIDSTHWRHFWLLLAMVWGLTIAVDRGYAVRSNNVMFNRDKTRTS